jgi:hypothetical protein
MEWAKRIAIFAVLPIIYLTFLSCTDSGKKIDDMARNRSLVSVHLLHEPSPGFDEINLPIVEVKASETATVQL